MVMWRCCDVVGCDDIMIGNVIIVMIQYKKTFGDVWKRGVGRRVGRLKVG